MKYHHGIFITLLPSLPTAERPLQCRTHTAETDMQRQFYDAVHTPNQTITQAHNEHSSSSRHDMEAK